MKRGYGPGKLWKRGGAWTLDYTDEHGRRRRKVLGRTKREAEELRAEIISARNRALRDPDPEADEAGSGDIRLARLRDIYLADLRTRATPKHVQNTEIALGKILAAVPAGTVGELTPVMVVEARAKLLAAGSSRRWVNVLACALQAALRWAVQMDLVEANPIEKVRKLRDEGGKHQRCKRRALSETEIDAFLTAAREEDEEFGRHRVRVPQAPMWRTLLEVGCRYGELRQATWSDLDEEQAVLELRAENTKAGRARIIPLGQGLLADLAALKPHHWRVTGLRPMPEDPLFLTPRGRAFCVPSNNINRMLRRVLERAGIDRVNARGEKIDVHALRHTLASRLARNNVPIAQTQRLLGHADPSLTAKVYTHLLVEDLRDAVETLHTPPPAKRVKEAQ